MRGIFPINLSISCKFKDVCLMIFGRTQCCYTSIKCAQLCDLDLEVEPKALAFTDSYRSRQNIKQDKGFANVSIDSI